MKDIQQAARKHFRVLPIGVEPTTYDTMLPTTELS